MKILYPKRLLMSKLFAGFCRLFGGEIGPVACKSYTIMSGNSDIMAGIHNGSGNVFRPGNGDMNNVYGSLNIRIFLILAGKLDEIRF